MKILVAEDDFTMRQMLGTLLSRRKVDHVLVQDGMEAVEAWATGEFDMIFMDVQMPALDGFEATRMIRERENTLGGHTTIIAMTAHALERDRKECLDAGMDDYISKPINFNDLFGLIMKYSDMK